MVVLYKADGSVYQGRNDSIHQVDNYKSSLEEPSLKPVPQKHSMLKRAYDWTKIGLAALPMYFAGCGNPNPVNVNSNLPSYTQEDLVNVGRTQGTRKLMRSLVDNLNGYASQTQIEKIRNSINENSYELERAAKTAPTPLEVQMNNAASKTSVINIADQKPLPDARTTYFNVKDIGNNLLLVDVSTQADGYLDARQLTYIDKGAFNSGSAPLSLQLYMIPDDPKLLALMEQTTRNRRMFTSEGKEMRGTLRFKENPDVYISLDDYYLKGDKLPPDEYINWIKEFYETEFPKWNNGFSANPNIKVINTQETIDLYAPGRGKYSDKMVPKDGTHIVSFSNAGEGGFTYYEADGDGWLESSIVILPTWHNKNRLFAVLRAEAASAFGSIGYPDDDQKITPPADYWPEVIKSIRFGPLETVLHNYSNLDDFSDLDKQLGAWLYSVPAFNYYPNFNDKPLPLTPDLLNAIPLFGDMDNNHSVDFSDFVILARAFDSSQGMANYDPRADLNQDGTVSFSDFVPFARQYGNKRDLNYTLPDELSYNQLKTKNGHLDLNKEFAQRESGLFVPYTNEELAQQENMEIVKNQIRDADLVKKGAMILPFTKQQASLEELANSDVSKEDFGNEVYRRASELIRQAA